MTVTQTPLLDRARAVTFGARPDYRGSDAWRAERTDAAAQLAALAITEAFPTDVHDVIARAARGLLEGDHAELEVAAELLALGCRLYAEGGITDLDRLLFSEVALPWHRPITRLDVVLEVQRSVDEWHRAGQVPACEEIDAETNVKRYREEWWQQAVDAATASVRADHVLAQAQR